MLDQLAELEGQLNGLKAEKDDLAYQAVWGLGGRGGWRGLGGVGGVGGGGRMGGGWMLGVGWGLGGLGDGFGGWGWWGFRLRGRMDWRFGLDSNLSPPQKAIIFLRASG